MRSRVKSERGEGEEKGKGGVKEEREGIEGETHLTDKPRLHRRSDDSSVSYPTPQTDSLTALPLIHCTSHNSSRFDLYPFQRRLHHTCSPGEECRVRNTCNRWSSAISDYIFALYSTLHSILTLTGSDHTGQQWAGGQLTTMHS